MAREIATSKGTWRIYGISFTPSNSIYTNLKNAIENGNLWQSYLQRITGYNGTILIDRASKEIHFLKF